MTLAHMIAFPPFSPRRRARVARALAAAVIASLVTAHPAAAQSGSRAESARSPGLPLQTTRTVRFSTDEGTWMSLDVSPDGQTIVFDLIGDLYTIPITGGTATRITSGLAMDGQPRFSPDGKRIVFTTDRSGGDNVWVMNADGSNARAVTRGDNGHYVSPAWTPDGESIVVSRNVSQNVAFTDTYDLYLYNVAGGGGIRLAGGGTPTAGRGRAGGGGGTFNYLGPAFGRDPRYLYFSRKPGGWGYNLQFPGWQVYVYDRQTGRTFQRTSAFGSGMRPALSPDGKWLVYATRVDTSTVLRIRDLATDEESTLLAHVQRDDQESRFTRDLLPGYAFTPDSKAVVLSHDGKFWRAEVPSGRETPIPFTAAIDQQLGPPLKFTVAINDTSLTVQQIRDARPSPDGKRLVFSALDRLWIMDLSGCGTGGCTPHRLTQSSEGEFEPVWSPDGTTIAYVTWTDRTGGGVWRVSSDGRGVPERLSRRNAFYQKVAYSPDGTKLFVTRGSRQARLEEQRNPAAELVWMPAGGGDAAVVAPVTGAHDPHFVRSEPDRVYLYDGGVLESMRFDGTDVREHLRVTGFIEQTSGSIAPPQQPTELLMSPDGTHAIASVTNDVYLIAVPVVGGTAPTVSVVNPAAASVPVRRITHIGGDFIGWAADGDSFYYSLGHSYFTSGMPRAGETSTEAIAPPTRTDINIVVPRDRPSGVVALVGARLVTMRGNEVIEHGTIVVRNNRIAAIGPSSAVKIPAGAHRIDVTGETIIPGLVDVHAHMPSTPGVHRSETWAYEMMLAYGVTTTRNPQTGTADVLTYSDRVDTGDMIGPRIYSTGPGIFSQENIRSLDDARDVLRRYAEFYDTHTIKEYETGQRNVRQWIIMAARELGLMPTTEGSLNLKMNITEVLDGYPSHEHNYPIYPLYKDIVQLVAQSGITYTPTLLVAYGAPWTENYWYEHYDIHSDPKVRRFMPHYDVDQRSLRRPQWFRDDQYAFKQFAAQAKKIADAGGHVVLGGHGQMQGLGTHWELWSLVEGGFTPMQVLHTATQEGADAIGLGKELGSLEAGKLADLDVLDRNVLDDIRNSVAIRYVMKNGRLYDGKTLDEVWPRHQPTPPMWWVTHP